ncbi:DUF5060 domain-containing protein [uncultured Draconibacterium sp.]|uniref:DUF5060 domain-containing protein n=1 Tax=uncultured Draconibacterium sp. TaxID=1573823 RepID=UPI003260A1D1
MKYRLLLIFLLITGVLSATNQKIALYRLFQFEVENKNEYSNKYTGVELNVQYQSPSGLCYNFHGFYDGDGKGNADGTIWKLRFMPNETGEWTFTYSWSDGTTGGTDTFLCVNDGAGNGMLKAYEKNPHWFAYNGTRPVWLKSYYETGHGSLGQDFEWVKQNVYWPLINNGYNHLQVNWLLSLCCTDQYYKDGPEPETLDLILYEEGNIWNSMNHDVWRRMEQHLGWLNNNDVNVHMFLGVDGSQNNGPDWSKLTAEDKARFVKYMIARLAPFANIAGWNFVWEVPGNREDKELGFARLVQKYDIFEHLRTYEDEFPRENEYGRNEYSFAAVENHEIASPNRDLDRKYWKEPWTHHMACLLGYAGKPVFMSEGNALWRRFWQQRTKASRNELRQSAWACATAAASFTWCGHAGEEALFAAGAEGLPFNEENPYTESAQHITILADIMQHDVAFYEMKPSDELLSDCSVLQVYALAEPGEQYLVFATAGSSFSLQVKKGDYNIVKWIDTKNGTVQHQTRLEIKSETTTKFNPPTNDTDWVLVVKR